MVAVTNWKNIYGAENMLTAMIRINNVTIRDAGLKFTADKCQNVLIVMALATAYFISSWLCLLHGLRGDIINRDRCIIT